MKASTEETVEAFFLAGGWLSALLRPASPPGEWTSLRFRPGQSLLHLAEVLGIPRTEVGGALVNGRPSGLGCRPSGGERIEFRPIEESLPTEGEPRFLADVHLGRLARDLRLLGFDVSWRRDLDDRQIVERANAEGRIVLTHDRGLLFRSAFLAGAFIRSRDHFEQVLQVARRFGLGERLAPLSRCSGCGERLVGIPRESAAQAVPTLVYGRYDEFYRCPACGKTFWKGDHMKNIVPFIERLRELIPERTAAPAAGSEGAGGGSR